MASGSSSTSTSADVPFMPRLFNALRDAPATHPIAKWSPCGQYIVVCDTEAFPTIVCVKSGAKPGSAIVQMDNYRFVRLKADDALPILNAAGVTQSKTTDVYRHESITRDSSDEEVAAIKTAARTASAAIPKKQPRRKSPTAPSKKLQAKKRSTSSVAARPGPKRSTSAAPPPAAAKLANLEARRQLRSDPKEFEPIELVSSRLAQASREDSGSRATSGSRESSAWSEESASKVTKEASKATKEASRSAKEASRSAKETSRSAKESSKSTRMEVEETSTSQPSTSRQPSVSQQLSSASLQPPAKHHPSISRPPSASQQLSLARPPSSSQPPARIVWVSEPVAGGGKRTVATLPASTSSFSLVPPSGAPRVDRWPSKTAAELPATSATGMALPVVASTSSTISSTPVPPLHPAPRLSTLFPAAPAVGPAAPRGAERSRAVSTSSSSVFPAAHIPPSSFGFWTSAPVLSTAAPLGAMAGASTAAPFNIAPASLTAPFPSGALNTTTRPPALPPVSSAAATVRLELPYAPSTSATPVELESSLKEFLHPEVLSSDTDDESMKLYWPDRLGRPNSPDFGAGALSASEALQSPFQPFAPARAREEMPYLPQEVAIDQSRNEAGLLTPSIESPVAGLAAPLPQTTRQFVGLPANAMPSGLLGSAPLQLAYGGKQFSTPQLGTPPRFPPTPQSYSPQSVHSSPARSQPQLQASTSQRVAHPFNQQQPQFVSPPSSSLTLNYILRQPEPLSYSSVADRASSLRPRRKLNERFTFVGDESHPFDYAPRY